MAKTFFAADLHLGHKNILSYDNRPFRSIEEHDDFIISAWMKKVSYDDKVYVLGDVSWHPAVKTVGILQELPGRKILIAGNHDEELLKHHAFCSCFDEVTGYKEIFMDKVRIVLSHYPMPAFNGSFSGSWHFYGHVHNSFEANMINHYRYEIETLYGRPCNMVNIGLMQPYMAYSPQEFSHIVTASKKLVI